MDPLDLAIPLVTAFGAAALLTPWVGRLALAVGAVDRPNDRKVSRRENMPLLGGLAVAAGFMLSLAVTTYQVDVSSEARMLWGLVFGGSVLLVTGAIDDRFGLGASGKLLGQVLAAGIAVHSGFLLFYPTNPLTLEVIDLPDVVMWAATGFWIIGVTNAVNLLDGLDGLASGVAAIIATTLAVISYQAGHPIGVWIGIALVGALLGFLPHNFSPARIFLGDTGSLFIGFVLSLMALECYRRVSMITLLVPLLTLAVPLLDTSLSIFRRLRSGKPVFTADRMHIHHRLLASEGSARAAVLQFYLLTAAFCMIALSFAKLEGFWAIGFLLAVVLLTIRLLLNLGLMSVQTVSDPPALDDDAEPTPRPPDVGKETS